MTNPTTAAAPLTRREAREIERATGVRPVAAIAPTAVEGALTRRALREQRRAAEAAELRDRLLRPAFDHRHDTGEIERNDVAALVSVLPAELVEHLSAGADGARPLAPVIPLRPDGAPRGASLRAPVPASLAAARRRRAAGGFAAAASATALAATGLAGLGAGEQPAEAQHRADLAAATQQQPAPQTLEVPADAESPQAAEAPAPELDADESSTSVEEFDVDGLVTAAQPIIVEEEEEPTLAAAQAEEQGTSTGAAGLSSPVGPGTTLSSGYGYRAAPIAGAKPFHDGIDLSGSCGIPLYAVTSGTVTSTGWDGTYGERLDLRSDDGVTSFMYAHLQGYAVAPGQQVAAGDLVGWLGTTGLSTGCHLHFEVHVGGGSVDPLPWLAERGIHV